MAPAFDDTELDAIARKLERLFYADVKTLVPRLIEGCREAFYDRDQADDLRRLAIAENEALQAEVQALRAKLKL